MRVSIKDLSSGFGKPGVENLEISSWGVALDAVRDWAGHSGFGFFLSPFEQKDLYLLFLTALLKSLFDKKKWCLDRLREFG
ncbi:hypothetical protein BTVI_101713 [Pitangus sulphuratus]|nr:hypothetical protein BTVI_101713 [Pitangus sulphuratus]